MLSDASTLAEYRAAAGIVLNLLGFHVASPLRDAGYRQSKQGGEIEGAL